uniref:Uncharacterized protein n=1 Tax=Oryza nivara TaxID=4536 RepID=A0A0E0J8N1_ORYNI
MCRRPTPHPPRSSTSGEGEEEAAARSMRPSRRCRAHRAVSISLAVRIKKKEKVPHKRHIDVIWEVNPPQKKEALYPVFRLRDVIHASATDEGVLWKWKEMVVLVELLFKKDMHTI